MKFLVALPWSEKLGVKHTTSVGMKKEEIFQKISNMKITYLCSYKLKTFFIATISLFLLCSKCYAWNFLFNIFT